MSVAAPSRVGVVGLGRIGLPAAHNLARSGFDVVVVDKRPEATAAFGDNAVVSIAELAQRADAVVIAVPGPEEAAQVLQGGEGVFAHGRRGLLVIDFTTLPAAVSRDLGAQGRDVGIDYLEAPVSGSEQGAIEGTLTIMAAGDPDAFERARPILDVLGAKSVYVGPPGAAMTLKLINQTIYIAYVMAFAEGLAAGEAAGIDLDTMLDVLATSAAGDPRIASKFPQMRGDTSRLFSVANAKRYFDFAAAGLDPGPITRAAHEALTGALSHGAGDSDIATVGRERFRTPA